MSLDTVPVIDISPFRAGDAGKAAVACAVADACTTIGFFAITGHGVPQNIIEDLREASHTYFEQPEEIKRASMHPIPDTPRGFRELAGEALGRTVMQDASPDLKEFYHYGGRSWPDEPYFTSKEGQTYFIPNLWPNDPPAFREAAIAYYEEMNHLVVDVIRIMALALGLPENWFDGKVDKHATAARLNYYPLTERCPTTWPYPRRGTHDLWYVNDLDGRG